MHNDEKTSAQLAEDKFTGTRLNEVGMRIEFWKHGQVVISVTIAEERARPGLFQRKMEEEFALWHAEDVIDDYLPQGSPLSAEIKRLLS